MRSLLLLLCLGACSSSTPAGDSIRILTYNIHAGKDAGGENNLERVAALIRASRADVVLLQEVDRHTTRSGDVDQLAALTSMSGLHGQFGRSLDYQGGEYGIAILSRWPVHEPLVIPLHVDPPQVRAGGSVEPRIALMVTLQTPTGPLRIANTHLDASGQERYRMQEVSQLVRAARGVIVGGDFNAMPGSAPYVALSRAGWRDAWLGCGRGDELTFPATSPRKRIDYVFLSKSFRCTSATVLENEASDHRPVLVVAVR